MMEKWHKNISKGLETVLVTIFSLLVIDVFWQVIARYSTVNSPAFTEELARYLLIWLSLLGAAYVRSYKGQVDIDYLYNKLSPKKQHDLSVFIEWAIILFALLVMVVGGINLMYITLRLGQLSPTMNIPMGYVYSVVPISGTLIIFYSACHCFHLLKKVHSVSSTSDD